MRYCLLGLLILFGNSLMAQTVIDWTQLAEVHYVRQIDLSTGYPVDRPRFSRGIKALEGEVIEIGGYLLPLDVSGEAFALSRYPFSACFFCGGAGLESVMNVWFVEVKRDYRLDQYVTLRGTLRLSDSGHDLLYLLEDAKEVR